MCNQRNLDVVNPSLQYPYFRKQNFRKQGKSKKLKHEVVEVLENAMHFGWYRPILGFKHNALA